MMCACVRICRTQAVIEKVQEHQHAAAHDHEHTDHDGGDVHRLLVLLLCTVVSLVLHVASAGGEVKFREECRPVGCFLDVHNSYRLVTSIFAKSSACASFVNQVLQGNAVLSFTCFIKQYTLNVGELPKQPR